MSSHHGEGNAWEVMPHHGMCGTERYGTVMLHIDSQDFNTIMVIM